MAQKDNIKSKCSLLGFPSQMKFLFWLQLVSIHWPCPMPPSNGKTAIQSDINRHRKLWRRNKNPLHSTLGNYNGSLKIEFFKWNIPTSVSVPSSSQANCSVQLSVVHSHAPCWILYSFIKRNVISYMWLDIISVNDSIS